MPAQVRLFVSAGVDQEPARELLGRALAELPVNVGWVIKRTPDVDAVAESHLFLLLMGADIWAPVGLELWWARRTEKPILAYRGERPCTPAGQVFLQENADLAWTRCTDLPALRRAVLADLGRFLLAHSDRYGVTVTEVVTLRSLVADLERPRPPVTALSPGMQAIAAGKVTGAAGGGVILAPGKDEPAGARLVE